MWPTRVTQALQLGVQRQIVARALAGVVPGQAFGPPLAMRLLTRVPLLNRIPARLVGMGVRPEHIASPELPQAQ